MSNFLDRRFLNLSLSVLSVADSPAANPTAGNQYIVGSNPTGAFASAAANQIARYDGSAWSFVTPKAGELEVLNLDTAEILCFNGSAWSAVASFADNNDTSASHILTVKGVGLSEGNDPYLGLRILEEFVVKPLYSGASIERIYPADADRFASISDGKIYTYHEADSAFTANDVPEGQIIFDASSFLFYQHDSTNHSFTPIHRAVNLPAVSRIVDSFVFNADDINTVKNSHSTEGYSFAHSYGTIYTFTSGSWQEESFSVGTRFAASHYVNSSHALILQRINDRMDNFNEDFTLIFLLDGEVFINEADNSFYRYDAANSAFVKVGGTAAASTAYEPIAPVSNIIQSGSTLPASCSQGDFFLNTSDAKLYTATAANTWNSGVITTNGSRYASSTDLKIYQSDGEALQAITLQEGESFLNKADNFLYVLSNSQFVKASNNTSAASAEFVTESHNLTAVEISAKAFSLANSVASGQESNVLLFVLGLAQVAGTDFTASGNLISWNGKGLEELHLSAGDNIIVHYAKE